MSREEFNKLRIQNLNKTEDKEFEELQELLASLKFSAFSGPKMRKLTVTDTENLEQYQI